MGQRANLIIVENGEYELYYDHWCANAIDRYLFWEPEKSIDFFRSHEREGVDWWLDDVWCEGGAVIDCDRNYLLFFGGEDTNYDIPLRRVFMKLLQKMWMGWQVEWAYQGIVDLARYVDYPVSNVFSKCDPKPIDEDDEYFLCRPEENDWTDGVISIKFEGSIRLLPIQLGHCEEILEHGNVVITIALKREPYEAIDLNNWVNSSLSSLLSLQEKYRYR